MAFLRVNGYPIDAMIDDVTINDVSVENFERNAFDILEGNSFSVKKEIIIKTAPLTPAEAHAVEGWVRGRRHLWNFNRPDTSTIRFTLNSADAGITLSGNATSNATPLFGPWAARMENTAHTVTTTARFGSEGDWGVHFYHRTWTTTSTKWDSHGVISRNGTISAWLNNASATTCRLVQLSSASGYLGVKLIAATSGGVATTCAFANLTVQPFALTTEMFQSLSSAYFGLPSQHWYRPPFVLLTGTALSNSQVAANAAGEYGPMYAKGFIEDIEITPCVLYGSFNKDARQLTIKFTER